MLAPSPSLAVAMAQPDLLRMELAELRRLWPASPGCQSVRQWAAWWVGSCKQAEEECDEARRAFDACARARDAALGERDEARQSAYLRGRQLALRDVLGTMQRLYGREAAEAPQEARRPEALRSLRHGDEHLSSLQVDSSVELRLWWGEGACNLLVGPERTECFPLDAEGLDDMIAVLREARTQAFPPMAGEDGERE
ncbi:MAG: hypothetical protein WCS88_03915 [Patescibacteria group bacterium]|jgi:hypothetical protein